MLFAVLCVALSRVVLKGVCGRFDFFFFLWIFVDGELLLLVFPSLFILLFPCFFEALCSHLYLRVLAFFCIPLFSFFSFSLLFEQLTHSLSVCVCRRVASLPQCWCSCV